MYALVLPFGPALPNILMAMLASLAAVDFIVYRKPQPDGRLLGLFWVINGFVFFEGLSVFWSDSVSWSIREWLQHLSLTVFFLILLTARKHVDHSLIRRISHNFIASTSVLFLLSLLTRFMVAPLSWSSISQNSLSTAIIDLHYLTFSIFASFGFLLALHRLLQMRARPMIEARVLVLALFVLGTALILLGSRTVLLITFALCIGYFFAVFHWKKAGILALSSLLLSSIALSIPQLRAKFLEGINYQNEYSIQDSWGGRSFRELIWNCSIHVIGKRPILGSGYGDEMKDLDLCYHQYRYEPLYFAGNEFNAHNIYLQMTLGTGILGLGFLILSLGHQLYLAIKARHYIYIALLGLLILGGLTESYLNRNAFILFFGFFSALFYSEIALDEDTSAT